MDLDPDSGPPRHCLPSAGPRPAACHDIDTNSCVGRTRDTHIQARRFRAVLTHSRLLRRCVSLTVHLQLPWDPSTGAFARLSSALPSEDSKMLPFLIGTAVITTPQLGLPAAALAGAVKAARHLAGGRGRRRSAAAAGEEAAAAPKIGSKSLEKLEAHYEQLLAGDVEPVTLQWDDVRCDLKLQGGTKRPILRGVSGIARPGRCWLVLCAGGRARQRSRRGGGWDQSRAVLAAWLLEMLGPGHG